MQEERNCGGDFLTIEDKETKFPPHHLGGTVFMWECPTSAIPQYIKNVIELFFLCYIRVPGMNGFHLQRQSLPSDKAPLEQDNWTMEAFTRLENAFMELEKDLSEDRSAKDRSAATKNNIKKHTR